jgi:hypothetical protein
MGNMGDKQARQRGYWLLTELAEEAGLSTSRLRQLLIAGKLHAHEAGQVWTVGYAEGARWLGEQRQRK